MTPRPSSPPPSIGIALTRGEQQEVVPFVGGGVHGAEPDVERVLHRVTTNDQRMVEGPAEELCRLVCPKGRDITRSDASSREEHAFHVSRSEAGQGLAITSAVGDTRWAPSHRASYRHRLSTSLPLATPTLGLTTTSREHLMRRRRVTQDQSWDER